MPQNRSQKC